MHIKTHTNNRIALTIVWESRRRLDGWYSIFKTVNQIIAYLRIKGLCLTHFWPRLLRVKFSDTLVLAYEVKANNLLHSRVWVVWTRCHEGPNYQVSKGRSLTRSFAICGTLSHFFLVSELQTRPRYLPKI